MTVLAPYRQFLLLSPQPGWRASVKYLTSDTDGIYRLNPLPGAAGPVVALAALNKEAPVGLAVHGDGPLHVLCAEDARIRVAPAGCEKQPHILPGIGGDGRAARRFRQPQDLAVLAHGEIAVADSGNGAVKIFSANPYALLAVWTGLGRPVRLAAGAHESLWVLDADARRALRVDRDGVVCATLPGVMAPKAVAANAGTVAVLDGSDVRVFTSRAAESAPAGNVPDGSALCFGPQGFLYVGTTTGLIYSFATDGADGWREAGIGVLGQQAAIARLLWKGGTTLLALVLPEGEATAQLWSIDTAAARARVGTLASEELDSGLTHCSWHRIALDADLPNGTSVEISTEAYDKLGGNAPADLVAAPIVLSDAARDCLVQGGTGRYLRLQLRLRGNGVATPVLRGIRIWFPRDGWLQYLPPVYLENEESSAFLARFLSILQTAFDAFDEKIDDIWMLFDARSVPDKWFAWLASWLALPIDPHWTDAQRRAVLRNAYQNYRRRGTPAGLEQLIADYTGVGARMVEHFRLRQLIRLTDDPAQAISTGTGRLWSRDAYRRLQLGVYSQVGMFKLADEPEPAMEPLAWGANQFSVFFDAAPATVAETRKCVAAVVEREKPAHTQATYRPVFARMRVGIQATLGVDTRVGETGQAVLGRVSTLGYDAILANPPASHERPARNAGIEPRLGFDTRLT